MSMNNVYADVEPARAEVDALEGPTVIEFGTPWCGHCRAAQPHLTLAFEDHPDVRHIKVEDGPGRPLGRSFKVKLWPTLIFMKNGEEWERLVRPTDVSVIRRAFEKIDR